MAEEDSGQDRSEEASPQRREDFRKKGQVAVSREINSVFTLAAVIGLFSFYFVEISQMLMDFMEAMFRKSSNIMITRDNFLPNFGEILSDYLFIILPPFLVGSSAAIIATFFQTRFNFSMQRLKPTFSKMNPIAGLGRMFGIQSLVELLKGLGKIFIISLSSYMVIKGSWSLIPALLKLETSKIFDFSLSTNIKLAITALVLLLIIAIGDYAFNRFSTEKKLKMTKQEVKEESKKTDGDPLVKQRLRRMAREIANKKMIEASKDATVIITNPTHYSVALKYEIGMPAPIVVAKGVDFLAFKIRDTAKKNNVPIVENPPLARTLYAIVRIGHIIPENLYKAVSEVIKYVFEINGIKNLDEGN